MANRAGKISEDVGKVVIERGGEALEKAKNLSEEVGAKVIGVGGALAGKAKAEFDKVYDKAQEAAAKEEAENLADAARKETDAISMDAAVQKAEELRKQMTDKATGYSKQTNADALDKGNLAGHDSFFEKAARFADGDYHDETAPPKEGEMRITDAPEGYVANNKKGNTPLPGFEDADGDGNELIDDATIIEDDDSDEPKV